ncbi:hypothetical protein NZNM25_12700 [Nitrosopumilus zosterae]|uniref:Uncharacterized protein n=1 Tax=Nitrosopumilus zosterae TaxID=718286 RepID=A0A2S2KS53_9ARCH|nr:hypothetical protein [Nitrosopumilus zosterae]BDQ30906.1 hypothetical protein NZOSNM25_001014 [Nitrosopumilus zosterae]GBH34479.1 hypothetical protein NZNM25_12700 [Nitrosopumilus zosterae]
MPLDKMPDVEQYVPTHKSTVLHVKGKPVACIIDDISNELRFKSVSKNNSLKASLIGFLNKHDDLGLLLGFKLKIQTDLENFEYTVYPNDEFIETVIFDESVFIINKKLEPLFSLKKIVTDQFVKTKTEFDKFQSLINKKT